MTLLELFCDADDFCQYLSRQHARQLASRAGKRVRQPGLCESEIMTIVIHRSNRHKVFAGLAARGQCSLGWFYGFKLHRVINQQGEILAFTLTPGSVDDRNPLPRLARLTTCMGQPRKPAVNGSARQAKALAFVH